MTEKVISDLEIRSRLAEDDYWCEGKIHPSINRLYVDVICPKECKRYTRDNGFCYCENCERFEEKGILVCIPYKQALHKFGNKGMI